jgi:pimeloyl-ACP methyl ester carboxylesterase
MWKRILAAAVFGTALLVPVQHAAGAPVADANGDGSAIEVLGDLDTADRIAVIVPGVDTSPQDFGRLDAQARALYAATGGGDVAVVAWLGYDPPEGLGLEAARELRAEAGAPALLSYVDGVAARRPDARITLIGHSYGAIVVGLAAHALPAQVRDLVTLGAPGMGADDVAGLRTRARVWSALAADDWIRRVPQLRILGLGLGTRPSSASFGSTALPTAGVAGHDGYLAAGSPTLAAVASVVTS